MAIRNGSAPVQGARFAERMNCFWIEPQKKDVMGYRITNLAKDEVVKQGTPLCTDEVAKTAVICRYAYVDAVATDKKTLTVKGGHNLLPGCKVAISGASPLTQLNLTTVEDEKIVLSAVNNDIKAGDVLVEVATVDGVVAPVALPNRIASSDAIKDKVAGAHEVIALQNVLHYPEEYLNKTAFPGTILLVGCPKIMFTIQ